MQLERFNGRVKVLSDHTSPWWIVAAAAFFPGTISAFQLWRASRDKDKDRDLTERIGIVTHVDAQTKAILDRLDNEVEELRKRINTAENERDVAEERARNWFSMAHNMRHKATEARSMVSPADVPVGWSILTLPPFKTEEEQ